MSKNPSPTTATMDLSASTNESSQHRRSPTRSAAKPKPTVIHHVDGKSWSSPLETLPPELRLEIYQNLLPKEKVRLDDPACGLPQFLPFVSSVLHC